MRDPETLVMWREAMKGKEGGNTTCNIITGALATTGTSRSYTVSHLRYNVTEVRLSWRQPSRVPGIDAVYGAAYIIRH